MATVRPKSTAKAETKSNDPLAPAAAAPPEFDFSKVKNNDHHVKGGFENPWSSAKRPGFSSFFKAFREFQKVEIPKGEELAKVLPVVEPSWDQIENPTAPIQYTWLGHAACLVQFDGFTILADPIFSQRCSASQWVGPKRYTPVPPNVPEKLPKIDLCIISHNHYDHLDTNTVRAILDRVEAWCVPLQMKSWLVSSGVPAEKIHELDWWESVRIGDSDLHAVCTPCQHFSGRKIYDNNKVLWASWAIIGPTKRFFFGGDTGYRTVPRGTSMEDILHNFEDKSWEEGGLPCCPIFKTIGEQLGPFDLAAIPIGAYSPRWFMSPVHCSPQDSVRVHMDVKSKKSVGIHWGTFTLTDEPILDPPRVVKEVLKECGLEEDAFITIKHGETVGFDDDGKMKSPELTVVNLDDDK